MKKVKLKYAVISVGKKNNYGHPTKIILDKLKKNKVVVYCTDTQGSIVATSDGSKITFNTKPSVKGETTPVTNNAYIGREVGNSRSEED